MYLSEKRVVETEECHPQQESFIVKWGLLLFRLRKSVNSNNRASVCKGSGRSSIFCLFVVGISTVLFSSLFIVYIHISIFGRLYALWKSPTFQQLQCLHVKFDSFVHCNFYVMNVMSANNKRKIRRHWEIVFSATNWNSLQRTHN